jgi:hypothetical protein
MEYVLYFLISFFSLAGLQIYMYMMYIFNGNDMNSSSTSPELQHGQILFSLDSKFE